MDDTKKEYARKWRSWYFASGQWTEVNDEIVEGFEREEMVSHYGGYADAPMLSLTRQDKEAHRKITVYSLDRREFKNEELAQLQEYRKRCEIFAERPWQEYLDFTNQWEKDHPDLDWLDSWESVYPSAYMVFVDYEAGSVTIETHHIYCRTYPDLLELLRLHA